MSEQDDVTSDIAGVAVSDSGSGDGGQYCPEIQRYHQCTVGSGRTH